MSKSSILKQSNRGSEAKKRLSVRGVIFDERDEQHSPSVSMGSDLDGDERRPAPRRKKLKRMVTSFGHPQVNMGSSDGDRDEFFETKRQMKNSFGAGPRIQVDLALSQPEVEE